MVRWNKHLYIHDNIKEEIANVIEDVYNKKYANVYLIIKSISNNLFDIMSLSELSNGLYKNYDIEAYGVAVGKKYIKEILIDIIEAAIDSEGNININNI